MTNDDRGKLAARYIKITDEQMALSDDPGDASSTIAESKLRAEQDEIERRLGVNTQD